MKKINFRGITESMSDGEMKKVTGGKEVKAPEIPPTLGQAACENKVVGSLCSLELLGSTYRSFCWRDENNKMHCGEFA